VPIKRLLSERMAAPFEFEALLESGVARFASFDLTWRGGLSLARKVAAAAEAHQLLLEDPIVLVDGTVAAPDLRASACG
jgi:L-alanine-DL-glutamate epimerase-like enolase superfamily enzyme